jgi:hypothetical protein
MPFPDICVDDRECCPNEIPTLCFQQQTKGSQSVQIRDKECRPITLNTSTNRVCFVARDTWNTDKTQINKDAEIVDPEEGIVQLTLLPEDLQKAGIWLGEFIVYEIEPEESSSSGMPEESSTVSEEAEAIPCFRFKVYLQAEENLTNNDFSTTGLTIAEVRLAIRDRCAEDNFLLDNVEFSNTEIAWALRRPVDFWNEHPPPIPPMYTPATFPYRYNWMNGVIAELLSIASHNYERNRLQYAAANLSVDDKDKSAYYRQQSERYRQLYEQWVLRAKKALNMKRAYNSTAIRAFGNRSLTYDNSARGMY